MDLSSGTDHIKDFTDGVDRIDISGLPIFTIGRIDNDATIFQEGEFKGLTPALIVIPSCCFLLEEPDLAIIDRSLACFIVFAS